MDEMLMNEEVVTETVEEVVNTGLGKGLKIGLGVGVASIAGGLLYVKVVKPKLDERKAKKEQEATEEVEDYFDEDENSVE